MAERKTALVTGASRNIGRAIAVELARRGFNIVVHGAQDRAACEATTELVRVAGAESLIVLGDVGKAADMKRICAEALARFGTIDALVNNAAIRPDHSFLQMRDEDWHRVLDVDLHAAFYACKAALPGMIARKWGRIVNLLGMNAMSGHAGKAHVSVAKHGLLGLTKSLAKEFGPSGVTVNAISPGTISGDRAGPGDPAMEALRARIPLGTLGRPEDIAALCGFLVSDEGGFVTGQMIASNGGAMT